MQDDTLLTQYANEGSEAAFSQIIARHRTLVYRTCLRETGSASQAEDAAQVVFLLLARKAKSLRAGPSLAGWLYQTARFVAKDACKQEARRRVKEELIMQEIAHAQEPPAPEWDSVEPLLNAALSALKPVEREAVLLRFLEGHTLAETGSFLGLTEDAARMRVTRAIEKMRRYLTAHGAAVTGVLLTALLASEAARPLPAHAAATITQGTLQAISTGPTANVLLLSKGASHTMKIIKIKFAALSAGLLLAGASVPPLVHALNLHKTKVQVLNPPTSLRENVTAHFTLGTDQHTFYSVTLPKGAYMIVFDERNTPGKMAYSVTVNDRNASSLPAGSPAPASFEAIGSGGTEFHLVSRYSLNNPKPVILDVHNKGVQCEFWLTVISPKPDVDASISAASPALAVPLFGDVVPKTIALGVPQTGRLEKNGYAYFIVTLKAGHYQSNLSFRDALGKQTEMNGELLLNDEKGLPLFDESTPLKNGSMTQQVNELHGDPDDVQKFTVKQDRVYLVTLQNQPDQYGNCDPVNFTEQIVPDDSPAPAAKQN